MTTFSPDYSLSKTPPFPVPSDQHTPQSPPFLPNGHAPSDAITTDKYSYQNQSFPGIATPPSSSFGSGRHPVIQTSVTDNALTPLSAPNSAHEDMVADSLIDDIYDNNPNKRRKTSGSFVAEHRSVPSPEDNLLYNKMAVSPSMQQIQEFISNPDCSPYRLVCERKHERSYPDPREDLIRLYGLQSTADKVARFDATGKKNKLRKSYKGHISGLAGKNDVVAKPTQLGQFYDQSSLDPSENKLQMLAFYPDEEWRLQNVMGKEMNRGFDMSKLRRGLAGITKGDIPGFDVSALGLEDELPRKRLENARSPQLAVGTPQLNGSATPGNMSNMPGGVNGEELRPQRKNKRRRYDEGSYEGHDGFEEDEGGTVASNGPGGMSSGVANAGGSWPGGDPNKQKKKKRKKNPDVDSPGMDLGRHGVAIYGR